MYCRALQTFENILMLEDREATRVANVKTIAARIAGMGEGLSIREFMDASALAAGTLIKAVHRGSGIDVAVKRYIDALNRAVKGE